MDVKNKLRNSLIRRIQKLSAEKLAEITKLLGKFEGQFKSRDKTNSMAGSWKELDADLSNSLTDKLHEHRAQDRQISIP